MKKIITALFMIIVLQAGFSAVSALQIDDRPEPGTKSECKWVNLRQTERDAKIRYYKKMLFNNKINVSFEKNSFKKEYRSVLGDKKSDRNYKLLQNNIDITQDSYLVGHYKKYTDSDIIQTYSVQPRKNVRQVYCYYADGKLAYMHQILGHYPRFPYISRQYNPNGKLMSITYYENLDSRYTYSGRGRFKGYWYKGKTYNRRGYVVLSDILNKERN